MYAGERQTARIRVEYMRALMRQEIGLFDTDTSTAQIIAGISSDTALLQDAIGQKVPFMTAMEFLSLSLSHLFLRVE